MQPLEFAHGFLAKARYDEVGRTLEITFRDGRQWTHDGVPKGLFADFAKSEQPMHFWATRIRQATGQNDSQKLYPVIRKS
jgi:hypothetical protein